MSIMKATSSSINIPASLRDKTNLPGSTWANRCYSRLLIDNHITEDLPDFMTRFDPDTYVAMAVKAGVESAMVYACCHCGNCYYPTEVGHMHRNLNGRDIFGMTVEGLKQANIAPIAYYTVIYHNHAAKDHPNWRMTDSIGRQFAGRYWHCCPNNAQARSFFKSQISEILHYDVQGMFIDMTFWPKVCCCDDCRRLYLALTGREIPTRIDWSDQQWVTFQRAREQWMAEFAHDLSRHALSVRPDITVTHQFSPVLAGWHLGQSPDLATASDYPSGDFYGGRNQQRLGVKVMDAFRTTSMPLEFMTSRCVSLRDHTSMKSEDELLCSALTTLAHAGAYLFIDAINPDGTLEEDVYERLGQVSHLAKPFVEKIKNGPFSLIADTGLYFSMASLDDPRLNGMDMAQLVASGDNMSHDRTVAVIRELLGTSKLLTAAHLPYRIVPAEGDLNGISTLIINNAAYMSAEEAHRLRRFVADGGTLLATGFTSISELDGTRRDNFALADVFGVSYTGRTATRVNYLHGDDGYVSSNTPAPMVRATTAEVLAKVALPYFDPDDRKFASIHCDPPGPTTEFAALALNHFGKGRCIYLYSAIMEQQKDTQQQFALKLFHTYVISGVVTACSAPACVETTILLKDRQEEPRLLTYLLCMVNWQQEQPNIAVHDIETRLVVPDGFTPVEVCDACTGETVESCADEGTMTVRIPRLKMAKFIEIRFERKGASA